MGKLLGTEIHMDWLKRVAADEQFERFVAEVTDAIVRTGYLMTWDLPETEDLVQETLLQVARRWKRVRSMDHPAAYARRILVNLVIDGHEQRTRRKDELDSDDGAVDGYVDDAAARALDGIDATAEFRWALSALSRQQRAVIVLRYWEDLPEAEVAELLACSVGTVKSTASRGAARLREVLGRNEHSLPQFSSSATNARSSSS
jgi:RNA polymerase sigma-70 factor (sigma-E family)